jgi:predicted anti-sigma-YlaC factor YlaD
MSDCEKVRATANAAVGLVTTAASVTSEDVEAAFRHLKRCRDCRESLEPDVRGRFVSFVILDRE